MDFWENIRAYLILGLESFISWKIRIFLILKLGSSISWKIRYFFGVGFFYFSELGLKIALGDSIMHYQISIFYG